jgi:glycosyltransferase involved in cell wall biosynthesis
MTRHWTINGRFLSQPLTGVQRYAHEIVHELDALLVEQPELATGLDIELAVPPDASTPITLAAIRSRTIGTSQGHRWEQSSLPGSVKGGLLSFCNTGPLAVRKQIICMHDVNTRTFPHSYSLPFRSLYSVLMPLLGRTARAISTVSNYSAGELARFGISQPAKIFVAPNGHEHTIRWTPRHSPVTRDAATPSTIVILGSNAPHKNSGLIIGMADRLAAVGLRVAVVGMSDRRIFKTAVPDAGASNILWLGRLSDDELAALLRDSLCLAFPSFVEGFGLPPLEAMAIGCPVVVSDRGSLPEICGDAALYAAPDNRDAWFDHFMRLYSSPALRAQMVSRGRPRTSHFRWRVSAERYLSAMAEADGLQTGRQRPQYADLQLTS